MQPWLAPWRSRRTLRRCFLLFTRRFSPRTVGISVLAHPTQNLFAQILPIIPPAPHRTAPCRAARLTETLQRQKKEKRKRDKTRFALITLSHAVSSKVSAAHSTNNGVQQTEKARRYWISIKPSRRTACPRRDCVSSAQNAALDGNARGLNLITALDNVHFSLPKRGLGRGNGGDPVTNASITLTSCSSDGYSNFPFIYRCAGRMDDD